MKKVIVTIVYLITLTTSCKNNEEIKAPEVENSGVKSTQDYFNFLTTKTDGEFLISSFSTTNSENPIISSNSSIKGDMSPLDLSVDNEKIIAFNKYDYSARTNRSYADRSTPSDSEKLKSIFGKEFKLNLKNNSISARSTSNENSNISLKSVYIPNLIKMKLKKLNDDKMIPGTEITWNTDSKNKNGVIILFRYNPGLQHNEKISKSMPEFKDHAVTIKDSGKYIVTNKDLKDFLNSSRLEISIIRAGYGISNDNKSKKDYSLAAYTEVSTNIRIKK